MQDKLIATPSRTVSIMNQYGIKMKKSLGQNFLIEPKILEKMIEIGQIDQETTVIEIGPGIGALTEVLARHAKEVIAFEIDQRFVEILKDTLNPYDNVTVVPADILSVDFDSSEYEGLQQATRLVVVANLPYYITTPIIMHLVKSRLPFQALVMMMQKEVAERLTATCGSKQYGSLTIALEQFMTGKIAMIVPRTVFIPQPNVDSAVLRLERLAQPRVTVTNQDQFEQFVQACFKQRRKTLWNNLRHAEEGWLSAFDTEQLEAACEKAQIDPRIRSEKMTIEDFAKLYQILVES